MKNRYTTSISLDEETAEIAERLPNLSHFVREQLRNQAGLWGTGRHVQSPDNRIRGKCNGMHKTLCVMCWPEGRPSRDDWISFCEGGPIPDASYQERLKHYAQLTRSDNEAQKKGRDAISHDAYKRKGVFFRLLTLIRGG